MSEYTHLSDAQIRNILNRAGVTYTHALVTPETPSFTPLRITAKANGVSSLDIAFSWTDEFITVTVYRKTEHGTQIASVGDFYNVQIDYDYTTQSGTVRIAFTGVVHAVVKLAS